MCKQIFLFTGLLLSSYFSHATESFNVTADPPPSSIISVSPRQFDVTFQRSPRLSLLLSQGAALVRESARKNTQIQSGSKVEFSHESDPIYWPGAGLYSNTDNKRIQRQRNKILRGLSGLSNAWKGDEKSRSAVRSLMTFIEASRFKKRLLTGLDEDVFLAGNVADPLISDDVTLVLPLRPKTVTVIGSVSETKHLVFSPVKQADDYINEAISLYTFSNSTVMVILPDGQLESHNVAYWNKVPRHLAPGAVIFSPFKSLPAEYLFLNETIPSLLQNRVM